MNGLGPSLESLEGKIISNFGLGEYGLHLCFKPEALEGKMILNFGCGGSNIDRDLRRKEIKADVIDLDLVFDSVSSDLTKAWLTSGIKFLAGHVDEDSSIYEKLVRIRRKIARITGRNFIQGDGRALPFADRTFDTILAHYSTYQIPGQFKKPVYRELLRVGDTLHSGPIFGQDFDALKPLAQELNFEIIVCHSLPRHFAKEDFIIRSSEDYDRYLRGHDKDERIIRPKKEASKTSRILGYLQTASMEGSSFIVLRRKEL